MKYQKLIAGNRYLFVKVENAIGIPEITTNTFKMGSKSNLLIGLTVSKTDIRAIENDTHDNNIAKYFSLLILDNRVSI